MSWIYRFVRRKLKTCKYVCMNLLHKVIRGFPFLNDEFTRPVICDTEETYSTFVESHTLSESVFLTKNLERRCVQYLVHIPTL